MKQKNLRTLIILLTLLALVFTAACGSGGKTGPDTTPGTTGQTTAPSGGNGGKTDEDPYFEFTLSMHDPITSNNGKFYQAWADKISEATDGHVKITIYGSSALASAADVGEMVETGGVDIGWVFTSFYAGQFPLTDVTTLPMSGFGNAVVATNVLWDLYDKYEELRAEWDNYKLLNLYGNPGMLFASVGKPIKTPSDLQGLFMRTPAGPITAFVTNLGASPIVMAPPDMYEALEKKNINSYIFEPAGITNFALQEVTDYITDMPLYDGAFGLVMNWDKWNSLPEKYQKIIEGFCGREGSLAAAQDFNDAAENSRKVIADAGVEWVSLSDADRAKFQEAADSIRKGWAQGLKTPNFDAEAYLNDALELAKKYGGK